MVRERDATEKLITFVKNLVHSQNARVLVEVWFYWLLQISQRLIVQESSSVIFNASTVIETSLSTICREPANLKFLRR